MNPPFSSRDIATGAWLALAVIAALVWPQTRKSLVRVARAALGWKLSVPILLMAAYSGAIVAELARLGWWTGELLKETVLWFVLSGVALMFSGLGKRAGERGFWRRLLVDQLKATVLFEWLASAYTFSLPVELALVPLLVLLGAANALAQMKEEYASIRWLTALPIVALGFYVIASGLGVTAAQFQLADPEPALKAFILGPMLSIAILPLAYAFAVVSAFEMLLVRLVYALPEDARELRGYTARRVFLRCRLSPRKVSQFTRVYLPRLFAAHTRGDIDAMIRLSRTSRRGV